MKTYVIVGTGVAGYKAAGEIARLEPDAKIHMINSEADRTYDRPALSKKYLLDREAEIPYLTNLPSERVAVFDNATVTRIERDRRSVITDRGDSITYDRLLLATGSRNRAVPSAGSEAVYLRTAADARVLRQRLVPGTRLLIVGGGFIGLETAISARTLGAHVTVVEAEQKLLSRLRSPQLSAWALDFHTANGVDIRLGSTATVEASEDGTKHASLTDSSVVSADIVLVGAGVVPNVELARDCGLRVDNGITTDRHGATDDENIFAAGEVTSYPISHTGLFHRTESWTAAGAQGVVAARNMTGTDAIYDELPWLWSDQGDHNIQSFGFPDLAYDNGHILSERGWINIGIDEAGRVVSAVSVNMGRQMSMIRRAVGSGQSYWRNISSKFDMTPAKSP